MGVLERCVRKTAGLVGAPHVKTADCNPEAKRVAHCGIRNIKRDASARGVENSQNKKKRGLGTLVRALRRCAELGGATVLRSRCWR
jgi:hypothetical protein